MPITHTAVVAVADDGTSPVGSDEWNAAHTVTTIAATGGTVTTSIPVLDGTQTWNASGITFTGYKLNITNTASAAGSLLQDLQVGGNSIFYVDKTGNTEQKNGTSATASRVYNTYTDASNYERGVFDWTTNSNNLTIGTQNAGTGSGRDISFVRGGSEKVRIESTYLKANFISSLAGDFAIATSSIGNILTISNTTQVTNLTGFIQWAGQARITADVSFTSTVTLGALATLSVALLAGRTYIFEAELPFTCAAAGGARAALVATSGLTATNIIYDGWIVDSAANGIKGNTQATALGTAVGAVAITGTAGHISIKGTITVNVAGTLNVQGAQGVSSGTATVFKRGGYLLVHDIA